MLKKDTAWRTDNIGRILFWATDSYVREKLRRVRAGEFSDVTDAQIALFQNLDLGGTNLSRIAERAGMIKQSMLELVDKAETLGLVARSPDPDDARAKMITFTPLGLRLLEQLHRGILDAERRMARIMGKEFVGEMKSRLSTYVAESSSGNFPGPDLAISVKNPKWRMDRIGRTLFAATDMFVNQLLGAVHDDGFSMLTKSQLALLRNLDLEGSRLTEIALRARMTKQTVRAMVAGALRFGWVEQRPDPDDGRAKIIFFTTSGLGLLEKIGERVAQEEQRMASIVGHTFMLEMKDRLRSYISECGGFTIR